jgi:hypothetical protein
MNIRRPDLHEVLIAQGAYYAATGISPFVSRRAFEAVTGPKTEWWLVQTVGGLVGAVGAGLLGAGLNRRATPDVLGIAGGCAATLVAIDVVHVARGRISPVYLLDAVAELALLGALAGAASSSSS